MDKFVVILNYEEQDESLPSNVYLVQGTDDPAKLDHEVQKWKDTNAYYDEDSCTEDISDKDIIEKLGYTVQTVPFMYISPYDGLCQ